MNGPPAEATAGPYQEIAIRFAAAASEGRLQVRVDTPAGASEWQELALPLDGAEADRLAHQVLLAASHRRRGEEPARRLGQALFEALFARQVLGRYHATVGASRAVAPPLRLRFHLGAGSAEEATLHRLPWELLCEPGHGDGRLLALDRHLSVVRHLTVADGVATPPRPRRLRVLVAAAEGRAPGAAELDLGGEIDSIRAASGDGSAVAVEVLRPATLEALIDRLRGGGFHVLHLSGHGDLAGDDGVVLLPDAGGRLVPWHGERLATQLDGLSPLRLVVLNACRTAEAVAGRPFAGVAGAFLARSLPAVLAMQAPITDTAAAAFATAVYERLAAGAGLDAAVSEGRLAISRKRPQTFEWAVPVLFSRLPGADLFAAPVRDTVEEEATGESAGTPGARERSPRGRAAGGDSAGRDRRRPPSRPTPAASPRSATRWLLALLSLVAFVVFGLVMPRSTVDEPSAGEVSASREAEGGAAVLPDPPRGATDPAEEAGFLPYAPRRLGTEPHRRTGGEGKAGTGPAGGPAAGAPGGSARRGEPDAAGDGTIPTHADGVEPRHSRGDTAAAVSVCGPTHTLRSGDAVEVAELDATLVARIFERRPQPGSYVTLFLVGPGIDTWRSTIGTASLNFRDDAPLVVRVLAIDPVAGTVRLSCDLVD